MSVIEIVIEEDSSVVENMVPELSDVPLQEQEVVEDVLTDESPIEDIIMAMSAEYGYPYNKAYYLAVCESELDPKVKNSTSTATGLYQFLDGTWEGNCEGDRLSPIHNARCAMRMLSEGGKSHWLADPGVPICLAKYGIVL